MSTSGLLTFQGTDKATFVGTNSNVVIDTVKASLGVGVDANGPTSNLHVTGNAYFASDITTDANVYIGGNLSVNVHTFTANNFNLLAQGHINKTTFIGTSNVVIDTDTGSLGVGVVETGPTSNLHVVGNAFVSSDLSVNGIISGNGSGLTTLNASNIVSGTLTAARIPDIWSNLASNVVRIETLETANTVQSGLITDIETDVTDNASRITTLESANTVQGGLITTIETDVTDNASRITTLESANTVQGGLITAIETDVTDNASRITTLETANTVQGGLITAIETDVTDNASRITTLETANTVQGGLITTLETDVTDNASRITTLETANTVQGGLITAVETDVASNASKIAFITSTSDMTSIASNLSVTGNLTILGTTTTVDTDNLRVKDPIIELGKDNTASPIVDLGLILTRPTGNSNVAIIFDESTDKLEIGYTQSNASDTDITMQTVAENPISVNVNGNVQASTFIGDGSLLTGLASNLHQVTENGNVTSTTIQLTNATTGLVATGNVEASKFVGDGSLLTGLASNLHQVTENGNVTSTTIQLTNATTGLVATGNVEASKFVGDGSLLTGLASNLHQVSENGNVTSNTIQLTNATTGLVATGNVEASKFIGDGSLLTGVSSTLQAITDAGNVTSNTIQFTNATTGLITTSNIEVGGTLKINTITAAAYHSLQAVTNVGSITSKTVQFSNTITSLTADSNIVVTGNVTAGSFLGDGTLLSGIALSADLTDNASRITTLESANTVQGGLITAIETDVTDNASRITTLESANTVQGGLITAIETDVTDNASRITTLETANTVQGGLITAIETDVTDNASRITTLESANTVQGGLITAIETDVTDNASRITTLESANTVQGGLITAIETDVTDNASRITTLESANTVQGGLITAIETDVASNASKIAFVTSTVDTTSIASNLNVTGNLTILGTTTTVDTDNLRVKDPIIELGKGNTASPIVDLGLILTRPTGNSNVAIIFDESTDTLEIGYTQGNASDTDITMQTAAANPISVNVNGTISGNGSGLTALNATNIASGTIDAARIPTLNQNTTGSAGSATTAGTAATLTTARTIGGVNFDGSVDIVPTTFGAATFSGDVAFNTNTLFVDTVNSRVGIGTASPAYKLNILTDTNYDGISLRDSTRELMKIAKGTDGAYINMFESGVSKVNIATGGDSYFIGGNVGIGTDDPKQPLEVKTDAVVSGRLGVGTVLTSAQNAGGQDIWNLGTAARLVVRCLNNADTTASYANAKAYAGIALVPGFDASDTTNIGLWGSGSGENPKFYIQNMINNGANGGGYVLLQPVAGNVGIGTTSPGRPLDVQFTGDMGIRAKNTGTTSSDHASVYIDSGSGYSYLRMEHNGAAKFWLQSTPTGDLAFRPSGGGHVMDIKNNGNVGIGTSDPQGALHVAGNSDLSNTSKTLGIHMGVLASSYAHMEIVCSGSFSGWIDFKNANTSGNGDYEERIRGGDGNLVFHTNKAERMRIDASGNVGIGTQSPKTSFGTPAFEVYNGCIMSGERTTSVDPNYSLYVGKGTGAGWLTGYTSTGGHVFAFYNTSPNSGGWNGALASFYINQNTTTGRSINAGGTVNASGSDYAEYVRKKDPGMLINKGDIVGINSSADLTNVFSEAITFVVKSTNPSYVGGDSWDTQETIVYPPDEPKNPGEDASEEDINEYNKNLKTYELEVISFNQKQDEKRKPYDRIAFCGQVPVNVYNATPGQYIIPIQTDDDTISYELTNTPTFEQYRVSIGKVMKIQEDGRAFIIVKIS